MVTFKRILKPSLLPATDQVPFEINCSWEVLPCAVSDDADSLRNYAEEVRARFSATFESYEIFNVKEVKNAD